MKHAVVFKSLSDETRLRILFVLLKAKTELCICELMDSLDIKQYNVSKHMKELKTAGLVKERKEGRFVFYGLNKQKDKFVENILRTVSSIPYHPGEVYQEDIKRLKKRISLRVGCKVVVTMRKKKQ